MEEKEAPGLRDMTVLLGEDATLEFREIAKFRIEIKSNCCGKNIIIIKETDASFVFFEVVPCAILSLWINCMSWEPQEKKRKEKDMIYTSVLGPVAPCIYNAAIVAAGLNATLLPLANPMAHLQREWSDPCSRVPPPNNTTRRSLKCFYSLQYIKNYIKILKNKNINLKWINK